MSHLKSVNKYCITTKMLPKVQYHRCIIQKYVTSQKTTFWRLWGGFNTPGYPQEPKTISECLLDCHCDKLTFFLNLYNLSANIIEFHRKSHSLQCSNFEWNVKWISTPLFSSMPTFVRLEFPVRLFHWSLFSIKVTHYTRKFENYFLHCSYF